MRADDIMTEEAATVELGSSVAGYAQIMFREGTRSIAVMADGSPVGIVTESDVFCAGVASGKLLSAVPTRAVMSGPIKWIRPGSTTCVVAEKTCGNRMERSVVIDGSEMVSIATATDVAFHLSDVARGAGQMIELKDKWESDCRFR